MSKKISRRDFLDGVAKGVGAAAIALSPLAHLSLDRKSTRLNSSH